MTVLSRQREAQFTPEKYLELERSSKFKHEYVQGHVIAMAGATRSHEVINDNLTALFVNHFRGTACISHSSGVKVYMPELGVFYYPDQSVTCDEEEGSGDKDFILYPKLIVEVLSKTTAAFDRGDKFADYQTIPSLEEYVLVHQDQMIVERFFRDIEKNVWLPHIHRAKDMVRLKSIGFTCPIESLYEKVENL